MTTAADCPCALIVALGDLGRSPRMVNHARALRARGWEVTLAGYGQNPLPPDPGAGPALRVVALDAGGAGLARGLRRLAALVRRQPWAAIVVQNPPGFPALAAIALAGRGKARLILDWHNLGGTLLALRPAPRRHAAGLYAWCERRAARWADAHWAVSAALAGATPGARAVVVHDRPSRIFRAAAARSGTEAAGGRLEWWQRVLPHTPPPTAPCWVVAPSSWGPDEDGDAMLRVAQAWRNDAAAWGGAPRLTLIATGKGPLQADFARAAAALTSGPVEIRPGWVPAAEYPALLAQADAGLCLHRSSSGLDLPMKLADFRGAGRKALVLDYGPVLAEVFRPEVDGWTFRNDAELAAALRTLALKSPAELTAPAAAADTWEEEWDRQLGGWARALEPGKVSR